MLAVVEVVLIPVRRLFLAALAALAVAAEVAMELPAKRMVWGQTQILVAVAVAVLGMEVSWAQQGPAALALSF
jgi:hypothetical protein